MTIIENGENRNKQKMLLAEKYLHGNHESDFIFHSKLIDLKCGE